MALCVVIVIEVRKMVRLEVGYFICEFCFGFVIEVMWQLVRRLEICYSVNSVTS